MDTNYYLDLIIPSEMWNGVEKDNYKELSTKHFIKAFLKQKDACFLEGVLYYEGKGVKQDKTKAFRYFTDAANNYHPAATYNLFWFYLNGWGCPKNHTKAVESLRKAADLNHLPAILLYAQSLKDGNSDFDISQHPVLARKYFLQGARLNETNCAYQYALMCENGEGGMKDMWSARHYYAMIASRVQDAAHRMGHFYYAGESVDRDYKEAFKYFLMAAQLGGITDIINVGNMYAWGCGTAQNYDDATLYYVKAIKRGSKKDIFDLMKDAHFPESMKDHQKALEEITSLALCYLGEPSHHSQYISTDKEYGFRLIKFASDNLYVDAYYYLALCYYHGMGVAKDEEYAFQLYEFIQEHHYKDVTEELSLCYIFGKGTEKDTVKGFFYAIEAAQNGKPLSMFNTAALYYTGDGTTQDLFSAYYWYHMAALENYTPAYKRLAQMFNDGVGTDVNKQEAYYWFKKAYDSGDKTCAPYLADMSAHGVGTTKDYTAAYNYFLNAAEQNMGYGYYGLAWCMAHGRGTKQDFGKALEYCNKSLYLNPKDSNALQLRKELTNGGSTLRPISDLHDIFADAAGNVVGEIAGALIGGLLDLGDND